ncbi:MAG: TraB/GumN family protein [Pseudomonadota bacterium]|nr:TraB/GumN family protein [Pseudomonadota bacterium]
MMRGLLLALALWITPTLAQTPAPTATATAAVTPSPFLWRVDGEHAAHYLLGSIHLLPAAAHPLPANIDQAYAAAGRLVLETDPDALASPEVQQQFLGAAHRDAANVDQQFGAALVQQLRAQAQRSGLPATVCEAYRAWFCALTLEIIAFQRAGFEAQYGIDQHFHVRGIEDDKDFSFLETTGQHLQLFTGMVPVDGRALLTQTLAGLHAESGDAPKKMLAAWAANDTSSIEAQLMELQQRAPAVYARLIRDRNRAWLPQLTEHFSSEVPTLVIVGAAHLVGPDGLVSTLRHEGWSVTPAESATAETP